jgi:hypothetical protein
MGMAMGPCGISSSCVGVGGGSSGGTSVVGGMGGCPGSVV